MSNQNDRFFGGFLAGSIFGGITGGLIGAWLASKLADRLSDQDQLFDGNPSDLPMSKPNRNPFASTEDLTMEEARLGLEEKISQLNDAIDQARQQLSQVNGNTPE